MKWLNVLALPLATVAGNWLGSRIQTLLTGRPAQGVSFTYTDDQGTNYKNIPVATKFFPALLVGIVTGGRGRPGWAAALLAGVVTGALVTDEQEAAFHRWTIGKLVQRVETLSGGRP